MMYDHEKSDPAIVAVKPRTKPGNRLRSWWSQGRGPRGTERVNDFETAQCGI
jgi:hypothetical protein